MLLSVTTITANTTISTTDKTYDGSDLVVDSGATVTFQGTHFFNTLDVIHNSTMSDVDPGNGGAYLLILQSLTVEQGATLQTDGTLEVEQNVKVDGGTLATDTLTAARLDVIHSGVLTGNAMTPSVEHKLDLELAGSVTVDGTSSIDVSGKGYQAGYTTGNTTSGGATGYSGGSNGVRGGADQGSTNAAYGDYALQDRLDAWGSGGASYAGGGFVKINADSMQLDGAVVSGGQGGYFGAGSGGGILLEINGTLTGTWTISAPGGGSNFGGGEAVGWRSMRPTSARSTPATSPLWEAVARHPAVLELSTSGTRTWH